MLPEVIPIAQTVVNWNQLLIATKQALGRPLTAHLDAAHMPLDNLGAWIAALGGLRQEGDNPSSILSDPGPLLNHGHVAFLVFTMQEMLLSLLEDTRLAVTSAETITRNVRIAIVSGTLADWREAITNLTSRESDIELRLFLNKTQLAFEKIGLSQMFGTKLSLGDGTFEIKT